MHLRSIVHVQAGIPGLFHLGTMGAARPTLREEGRASRRQAATTEFNLSLGGR